MLYSVLVDRHNQESDASVERLASLLRAPLAQLEAQLARGPVTLEADVPLHAARAARQRLVRQGVQAHIVDAHGAQIEPAPQAPPEVAPAGASSLWDDDLAGAFGELELGLDDLWGGQATVQAPEPSKPPKIPSLPTPPTPPERPEPEANPWGAILERPAQAPAERAPEPSLAEPPQEVSAGWGALGIDAHQRPLEPVSELDIVPEPEHKFIPRAPAMPDFGAQPLAPAPVQSAEQPVAPAGTGAPVPASQERAFDGQRLASAFLPEPDVSRPFAPTGYTDQPPHSVEIATALEILAPGSGHVYNGQPERMWHAATWFFLIVPWVKSVRAARARAVSILEQTVEQPEDGSLGRALKHAAVWYVVAALGLIVVSSVVSAVVARVSAPETSLEESLALSLRTGVRQADLIVGAALEPARADAVREHERLDREAMPASERAQRLFRLSLPACEIRDLHVCKASMQRVVELDSNHPYAFSLMTWASLQSKGGPRQDMPSVGELPRVDDPAPSLPVPEPRDKTP